MLETRDEYERVLGEAFGLCLERAGGLWARVRDGHLAWVALGATN